MMHQPMTTEKLGMLAAHISQITSKGFFVQQESGLWRLERVTDSGHEFVFCGRSKKELFMLMTTFIGGLVERQKAEEKDTTP